MASLINKAKDKIEEAKQKHTIKDQDATNQQESTQQQTDTQKPLPSEPQSEQPVFDKDQATTEDQQPPPQDQQDRSEAESANMGSSCSKEDPESGLSAHNEARKQKGVKPLQWSENLARDAKSHANKLANKNRMEHAGVEGQGENLYMSTGDATYAQAVESWLREEKDYHGENVGEGDFMKWGHFSQCLWHSTTHVGMGKAKSKQGSWFIVGRYAPPGNMAGEKPF